MELRGEPISMHVANGIAFFKNAFIHEHVKWRTFPGRSPFLANNVLNVMESWAITTTGDRTPGGKLVLKIYSTTHGITIIPSLVQKLGSLYKELFSFPDTQAVPFGNNQAKQKIR